MARDLNCVGQTSMVTSLETNMGTTVASMDIEGMGKDVVLDTTMDTMLETITNMETMVASMDTEEMDNGVVLDTTMADTIADTMADTMEDTIVDTMEDVTQQAPDLLVTAKLTLANKIHS